MALTVDFEHGDPNISGGLFDLGARLQRESPIAYSEAYGGFWIATRYEDITTISKDNGEIFITSEGATLPPLSQPVPLLPLESDPPQHSSYRKLLVPFLAPKVIQQYSGKIREIVIEALDEIVERGEGDAMADFAARIPARALACVLGFSDADAYRFDHDFSAVVDASGRGDPERSKVAMDSFMSFLREKLAERRANPTDADIVSAMVRYEIDGRKFTDEECLGMLFGLTGAGIDTTKMAIGLAVHAIGVNRAVRQKLVDDPAAIPGAVEECLRLEAPAFMTARTVIKDVSVGGVHMKPGDRVLMVFGWGNRDDLAFARPDEMEVDRTPNRHLSFGQGLHMCIGMHLARLELNLALEELLTRIPDFELVDPDTAPRLHGGLMWGFESLPIRLPAGPASMAA